jgi:hypothetical protein
MIDWPHKVLETCLGYVLVLHLSDKARTTSSCAAGNVSVTTSLRHTESMSLILLVNEFDVEMRQEEKS